MENHEKLGVPKTVTMILFAGAHLLHNFLPQGHGKKVLITFVRTEDQKGIIKTTPWHTWYDSPFQFSVLSKLDQGAQYGG